MTLPKQLPKIPRKLHSKSEADTESLGRRLAEHLPDGTVISLIGTLGAGKTRLVRAVAEAMGVPEFTVSSPTFVLVHQYAQGQRPIFHLDAYRIESDKEFQHLGTDEMFETDGLVFVEWADRIESSMPSERFEIRIAVLGDEERLFELCGIGPRYEILFQ